MTGIIKTHFDNIPHTKTLASEPMFKCNTHGLNLVPDECKACKAVNMINEADRQQHAIGLVLTPYLGDEYVHELSVNGKTDAISPCRAAIL